MDPIGHIQYMPGDLRLVDKILLELKSKGIFDQFRKDCISDVDTRPAYQNLRQRVESSVSGFLNRQHWKPDMNKNQMREKLRKHVLDGNYLEQGVERIVDQVVNPKVNTIFKPPVEDLVYNYYGVERPKPVKIAKSITYIDLTESNSLLPNDLEAVSPESNHGDKEMTDVAEEVKMDTEGPDETPTFVPTNDTIEKPDDAPVASIIDLTLEDRVDIQDIPLPNDAPRDVKLDEIELPKDLTGEINPIIPKVDEIPLPAVMDELNIDDNRESDNDSDSSSNSSIIRNVSPLTPIMNFDDSCDAKQGYDSPLDKEMKEPEVPPSSFRFTIESKDDSNGKADKKDDYKLSNQISMTTFSTPLLQAYDDSSDSNNLHIDYESDNSKLNEIKIVEGDSDSSKKKDSKDDKKPHKSSHSSREKNRDKDKRSDSKHSNSKDSRSSKDRKSIKDEGKSKSREKDSSQKDDKKDRDKYKHTSHRSKDSQKSSSSSHRSSRDDKKSSHKSSESKKDHKSSKDSHNSSKSDDKKSSSKKRSDDKSKKDKRSDDQCSAVKSNSNRRSTDRDSNDGNNSTSSKGSNFPSASKSSSKSASKSSSKFEHNSSSDTAGQSDKTETYNNLNSERMFKPPIIRVDGHLETPICEPQFKYKEISIKKPKIAANFEEAKELMKIRNELNAEEVKKNQDAALLLEFQQNVRPNMSQVYSNISGPELEFAFNIKPVEEPVVYETNESQEISMGFDIENAMFELHGEAGSNDEDVESICTINSNVSSIVEDLSENDATISTDTRISDHLKYFTDEEINETKLEKDVLNNHFKMLLNKDICLFNCDLVTVQIMKEASRDMGEYKIVELKRKHISQIKDVILKTDEVSLPIQVYDDDLCSPVKDYNNTIKDMVNTKTRQEIIEIILGGSLDGSPSKMPKVNFGKECYTVSVQKRKLSLGLDNNNKDILSPNKIRKTSDSDLITSTVQDPVPYNKTSNAPRSKYLGKAKRVGLSKLRKIASASSPSSDKSVENYEVSSSPIVEATLNGKVKPKKNPIQHYERSELYKPKLHYLSKRHRT